MEQVTFQPPTTEEIQAVIPVLQFLEKEEQKDKQKMV